MGASCSDSGRPGDFADVFVKSGCRRSGTDSSRRLPSVIVVVVLTFSILGGIGWIVTLQFGSLANELPQYTGNIRQKIADVRGTGKGGALEKVQKTVEEVKSEIQKGDEPTKAKDQRRPVIVQPVESFVFWPVPSAVGPMAERFAIGGLVIVLVIFMLIQREDLRNRLIRLVGYGRLTVTTRALEEAGQRISHYLLMQTIMNSSFGLAVGFALYLIGLPYAILWGFSCCGIAFHTLRRTLCCGDLAQCPQPGGFRRLAVADRRCRTLFGVGTPQ